MKVKDVMTSPAQSCSPETNLASAAVQMWESDCGVLPVINREGKVIGMVTDRDICMAAATKHRIASDITVWETISGSLYACSPDDGMKDALTTMAREKVRRLSVIDEDGTLQGMITMNDAILHAREARGKKSPDLSYKEVMGTLKDICAHRAPVRF